MGESDPDSALPPVHKALCIGAGPAGLTAGYLLSKKNHDCLVLEKDPNYVGGISRTVSYKGFRFDIGGHRFFSKSEEVCALWDEILGDDFIERPRKSRIFYKNKFYSYPLKPFEALFNLGLVESMLSLLSYMKAKLFPKRPVQSFADWVSNQFGPRLYQIFFKTYTEKVWGMPCEDISADWAAQRIKGLSLMSALMNALRPARKSKQQGDVIKSLITTFRYPRLGPGMMWEAAEGKIKAMGNQVLLDAEVECLSYDADRRLWQVQYHHQGERVTLLSEYVISSMPMRELVHALSPTPPEEILAAAQALKYRDFLVVALIVDAAGHFDDNWIYIHDSSVKVGRIQNFRSWSTELIPDDEKNCYGMEYFCFEGDGLWNSDDDSLIALAKSEIVKIGLVTDAEVIDGAVIRQAKAYPVYDGDYKNNINIIREYIDKHCPGLCPVGRNGMHKYNNQDHAMMTAMLTVENIDAGEKRFDVWHVNQDAEYHEGSSVAGDRRAVSERMVPKKLQ